MNDMTITKATCKRLNKYKSNPFIEVVGYLLERANMVYHSRVYSPADDFLKKYSVVLHASATEAFISTDAVSEWERRVCRGLASIYPDYIGCTFGPGLNGVHLKKDANKFVRLIVADIESGRI